MANGTYFQLLYKNVLPTFELGLVVIGIHEPLCVQMEMFLEVFVGFDGFQSNFLDVRQPNCEGNLISLFCVVLRP